MDRDGESVLVDLTVLHEFARSSTGRRLWPAVVAHDGAVQFVVVRLAILGVCVGPDGDDALDLGDELPDLGIEESLPEMARIDL